MSALVTISRLSVAYGSVPVLHDISVDLAPGRIVALIGPNGAGKTTLLRAIFGEQPRTSGSVSVCGLDPSVHEQRRKLWSVARCVTDTPALYEELTIREFLEFSARSFGVPEEAGGVRKMALLWATNLALQTHMDRSIRALSFGERRKVHVAAGFFSGTTGPRVLALDEPMMGLDPESRKTLSDQLRAYVHADGVDNDRTVIISSHELAELSHFADDVLMLSAGQVVGFGAIGALAAKKWSNQPYEVALFDDCADLLAEAIQARLALPCEIRDARTVSVLCPEPDAVQLLIRCLASLQPQFRVREIREESTALERIFRDAIGGGGPT